MIAVVLLLLFLVAVVASSDRVTSCCHSCFVDCKGTATLACSTCSTVKFCSPSCRDRLWDLHVVECAALQRLTGESYSSLLLCVSYQQCAVRVGALTNVHRFNTHMN